MNTIPTNLTVAQVKIFSDRLADIRRLARTEEQVETVEGMASLLVHSAREAAIQQVVSSLEDEWPTSASFWKSPWVWLGLVFNTVLSAVAFWFYRKHKATKVSLNEAASLNVVGVSQKTSSSECESMTASV